LPRKKVEALGIETPDTSSPCVALSSERDPERATQDDARRREVSASGDVVEAALARAIEAEVGERRPGWEGRVALLAGELRARRLARDGVILLREDAPHGRR
jgi:hypothetical protein